MRGHGVAALIMAAAAFSAVGLILYPVAAAAALTLGQIEEARRYDARHEEPDQEEARKSELEKAVAYNEALFLKQRTQAYHYGGEDCDDPVYRSLLNDSGAMCVLDYPAIGLTVPVVHGTGSEDLETAAGHFYGTSLPVGGESVHAGIAAHSGLPDAKLFSELEEAEEGDLFYIHVLGKTHAYRVTGCLVVEPEEADRHLQIEKGRDLVTLYTCTPFGLNTHRLLVRGERDKEVEEAAGNEAFGKEQEESLRTAAALKNRLMLLGLAVIITAAAFGAAVSLNAIRDRRRAAAGRTGPQKGVNRR